MMIDPLEQPSRTLQVFNAASAQFAVFADEVMTIAEWREPAVLPQAPASVLGVVSIHGRMLTVLDLLQLLEPAQRSKGSTHILALRGDEQLALAIEDPGETIELGYTQANGDFETAAEGDNKLITGVINYKGNEIKILNVKELFPAAIQGRERRRRRF
jgi:chemotaxis signal transduction protein